MITGAVFGLALVVSVSVDTNIQPLLGPIPLGMQMSPQQKNAAMRPLVRSATDCIIKTVVANPASTEAFATGDIRELIVDSVANCLPQLHEMISAHDRMFGEGTGEAFFMGPYLQVLPAAVTKQVSGQLK
jgi:hypothetical protein